MFRKLFAIIAVLLWAQNCYCYSKENINCSDKKQHQERTFLVSPQELLIDQNDVLVNIGGTYFSVTALEKQGSQWLAKIDPYNEFCPAGHNACGICHQCHIMRCSFYVPPCSNR